MLHLDYSFLFRFLVCRVFRMTDFRISIPTPHTPIKLHTMFGMYNYLNKNNEHCLYSNPPLLWGKKIILCQQLATWPVATHGRRDQMDLLLRLFHSLAPHQDTKIAIIFVIITITTTITTIVVSIFVRPLTKLPTATIVWKVRLLQK